MNELEEAISYYWPYIEHNHDDPIYLYLSNNIQNINYFDSPDGYIYGNNLFYIIEHFEFDASKSTKKKGSTSESEFSRVNRGFEKRMNTETKKDYHYVDKINADHNYKYYINNHTQQLKKNVK